MGTITNLNGVKGLRAVSEPLDFNENPIISRKGVLLDFASNDKEMLIKLRKDKRKIKGLREQFEGSNVSFIDVDLGVKFGNLHLLGKERISLDDFSGEETDIDQVLVSIEKYVKDKEPFLYERDYFDFGGLCYIGD